MFLIFGTHFFGLRNYAYKFMYCNHCKMPRLFIQTRAFAWGHIFWIPLIPLGYKYNWYCASCAKDDNAVPTSFGSKLVLLIALLTAFYFVTFGKLVDSLGESTIWWQIGVGILVMWSLYTVVYHFKTKEKNKYKYILPLEDKEFCAICDGELVISNKKQLQCKDCHCFAMDIEDDSKEES